MYIKRTLYSQRLILRGFPSESVVFRITAGLLAQIHPPSSSSRFPSDMSKDFVLYTVAGAALFIQIPCQAFRHCHAYSLVDSVHYMGDCSVCQEWAASISYPVWCRLKFRYASNKQQTAGRGGCNTDGLIQPDFHPKDIKPPSICLTFE